MAQLALPEAFLQRIQAQLGDEVNAFTKALETESPTSIRWNPAKAAAPTAQRIPWSVNGQYLPERPSFVADPLFHAGAYYVQEPSSMILEHMCKDILNESRYILDLCAAPGGKSTLLAGMMAPGSLLVSNEVIASRAAILAENMTRWGHPEVIVTQNDPNNFHFLDEFFDLVVVDAPCSGEGMFRKEAAAIEEWSPQNVATCALRQQRILRDIAPTVKPGGYIVYSTCTFAPAEDEEMVAWLLQELGESFELSACELDSAWGWESLEFAGVAHAAHRAWPHKVRGEGLFICRFRRKGQLAPNQILDFAPPRKAKGKKKGKQKPQQKGNKKEDVQAAIAPFIQAELAYHQEVAAENVFLFPPQIASVIPLFKGNLKMLRKGILAGKLHRKGFAPVHELALTNLLSSDIPRIELTKEQALQYLQKEDLSTALLPTSQLPTNKLPTANWLLPTFQNIPLGWAKLVGNRLKNQLPVNWRIRKLS